MASTQKSSPAPCSGDTLREATGRDWKEWRAVLDSKGAYDLAHASLARLVNDLHTAGGWWSQTIAVGYERLTGKRALYGQADGTFTASASKTLTASADSIYEAITNDQRRTTWAPSALSVKSATPHKSVRLIAKDGTRITTNLQPKSNGKTVVAVEVAKLSTFESVAAAKDTWRIALGKLAAQV